MLTIEKMALSRVTGESVFNICLPELVLRAGDIVVLKGDSGCGKSTLLEMIGLILKPDEVTRYDLSIDKMSSAMESKSSLNRQETLTLKEQNQTRQTDINYDNVQFNLAELIRQGKTDTLATIRARYFGFMLQTGGLLPFLTIKENILLPLKLLQQPLDQARITNLVTQLKISHLLSKYPKQLSIGERQRASFIRSIIHKPALLLADEPTSALDPYNANLLFDLIIEQASRDNIAAIIVTHDLELTKQKGLFALSAQLASPPLSASQSVQFLPSNERA